MGRVMDKLGRVFMLDDDRIFLNLYQNLLESKGYDVFATDNAYKFLIYGRELNPDVMFLDVNMPKMNGWEVMRQIIDDEVLSAIPAVMLTVNPDEDLAAAKGVAHFLYKPLALEALTDILKSYCQGNQNHDILLIEDYQPLFNEDEVLRRHQCRCFRTHNLKAAEKYLRRNKPKKIAVRYTEERFENVLRRLSQKEVYRIETPEDMEKICED